MDLLRDEFLNAWPHYETDRQIAKLEMERNEIAQKMTERVQRGGFDLSKINAADRWTVASRYCEMSSKIHDLDWQVRYLREAIRLSQEWVTKL
jgi:hypothetical protein